MVLSHPGWSFFPRVRRGWVYCPLLGSNPGLPDCATSGRDCTSHFTVLISKMVMTRDSASLGTQGSVHGGAQ